MQSYQSDARRPIADIFRHTARWATQVCVRFGVHPDAISYASIVSAMIAALCFLRARHSTTWLILAPLFCYVRLWFNMLDGMVAIASGQASRRGEILNDFPDRISDIIIFAGVAHSGWMNPFLGYWAAIMALLTAYAGTLGQAVGAQREFGGIMSKPWRMVALHLGTWATYLLAQCSPGSSYIGNMRALDWTCLIIIAGCIQTIAQRLGGILRELKRKEPNE